jgi:hypothetical protein
VPAATEAASEEASEEEGGTGTRPLDRALVPVPSSSLAKVRV